MKVNPVNDPLNPQSFEAELQGNILPFWMQHTLDHENGGFYGAVTNDLHIRNQVERSAVLCSRILWTFSTAARLYGEESYLRTARWAFDYLSERFWDGQYEGIYWSLDRHSRPVNDRKHTYAQAFSIYGLSAYYRATGEPKSLALAQRLFELIDTHTFDPVDGGNIECRARDWSALADMRLSRKEIDSTKSMNTLLHLIEAYASLAQVWPDESLSGKLGGLVRVFLDQVIDPHSSHQRLFFDNHWNSLSDLISYGHDIETSWLLVEAAEVLDDPALLARVRSTAVAMAQVVYDQALGPDGSILYEVASDGQRVETRHWWAHAEAVVGFSKAYLLSGQVHFARAAGQVWDYIQAHFIDRQNGDWFKLLNPQGIPYLRHYKVGPWECPYHHARMCYEMIKD
jgi:mannobiose 2-epimerase